MYLLLQNQAESSQSNGLIHEKLVDEENGFIEMSTSSVRDEADPLMTNQSIDVTRETTSTPMKMELVRVLDIRNRLLVDSLEKIETLLLLRYSCHLPL